MRNAWYHHAHCIGYPPALFDGTTPQDRREALTICLHCPVRIECLQDARAMGVEYGIRGGRVLHKVTA